MEMAEEIPPDTAKWERCGRTILNHGCTRTVMAGQCLLSVHRSGSILRYSDILMNEACNRLRFFLYWIPRQSAGKPSSRTWLMPFHQEEWWSSRYLADISHEVQSNHSCCDDVICRTVLCSHEYRTCASGSQIQYLYKHAGISGTGNHECWGFMRTFPKMESDSRSTI